MQDGEGREGVANFDESARGGGEGAGAGTGRKAERTEGAEHFGFAFTFFLSLKGLKDLTGRYRSIGSKRVAGQGTSTKRNKVAGGNEARDQARGRVQAPNPALRAAFVSGLPRDPLDWGNPRFQMTSPNGLPDLAALTMKC